MSVEMPEGFKRIISNTSPYDLLVEDKYIALDLMKEMAEVLWEIARDESTDSGYSKSEKAREVIGKFREWK